MIVCVAEKPSVGEYLARLLGCTQRRDGFFEGNGYCVTWTFGHLCSLLAPEDYNAAWKHWNMSSLPLIPPRFGIKVTDEQGIIKQFNIIKNLIAHADEVINCGDAGQEGELIQRWVYQKAQCRVPVKRLWINSLTEEAVKEGFQKLKAQDAYEHLYEAGLMRAIGDWLLGMNASRAYTLRYAKNRQIFSIGRVQTPTLALIVRRDEEIAHFTEKKYWELKTNYRNVLFTAQLPAEEGEYAITTEEYGNELIESIKNNDFTVTRVEKKKTIEGAPKLFDLTALQVECNKKIGLSAQQTLDIAQALYEKRLTTYPRVDTTYLPDDLFPKMNATLIALQNEFPAIAPLLSAPLKKSKKHFDSKKVTDHHAIIPTGQHPSALNDNEQKVFNLIAQRFIAIFYPDCEANSTTVYGEIPQETVATLESPVVFKTTGKQIIKKGWREVLGKQDNDEKDDEKNEEKILPDFKKGEHGAHTPVLAEKKTTPPKHYNEATLLRAMETAGKNVQDETLREALKANGIGRPSTRAAIIEKLLARQYIRKDKKLLKATDIGITLIHTIHTPLLTSAELTGQWEKKLRDIEAGKYPAKQFLDELKTMTQDVVTEVKKSKVGMLCPVCRKGTIIRGKTMYGCSRWREGCTYRAEF